MKIELGNVSNEFYVYGNERVAMIVPNTLGTTPSRIQYNEATFFLTDHLGNTRVAYMTTTTPGSFYIINALDYYPYGKVLREYDNGAGDKYLTTQHERDQETGLDYRGARYYDSDIARFLSIDPWGSKYPEWSTYNYVMGNPLSLTDPTGNGPEDPEEERKTPEKKENTESSKPGIRRINFGLFTIHFRKARNPGIQGIVPRGIDFSWNFIWEKYSKIKTKTRVETYRIDNMTRGGTQGTSIAPINYPVTSVGAATRMGRTLNTLFSNANISPTITQANLESQRNDSGGISTYVFFVGANTINHQNGFTPGMTILNPQQLTPSTMVAGSLVQQTPGPSGLFDQCNGYKLTVTVQYQVTKTVNRVRLVPRAPN